MDRNEIVRISRLAASGGLTPEDVTSLLLNYCLERGKDPELSKTFIRLVTGVAGGALISLCLLEALEWFKKKYFICEVHSKPLQGERHILYTY